MAVSLGFWLYVCCLFSDFALQSERTVHSRAAQQHLVMSELCVYKLMYVYIYVCVCVWRYIHIYIYMQRIQCQVLSYSVYVIWSERGAVRSFALSESSDSDSDSSRNHWAISWNKNYEIPLQNRDRAFIIRMRCMHGWLSTSFEYPNTVYVVVQDWWGGAAWQAPSVQRVSP